MKTLKNTLPRLRSTANFKFETVDYEPVTSETETVPNQSLNLETLLQRNAQGIPIKMSDGQYSPEDYPDFNKMSKTEVAQYRIDLADDMIQQEEFYHLATKELEQRQKDEQEALKAAEDAKNSPPVKEKEIKQ